MCNQVLQGLEQEAHLAAAGLNIIPETFMICTKLSFLVAASIETWCEHEGHHCKSLACLVQSLSC